MQSSSEPNNTAIQIEQFKRLIDCAVIDVRRRERFDQANTLLPGAVWRDPNAVSDWVAQLNAAQTVVVYCVFGHEVSQGAAAYLRNQGLNAFYLEGGIDAWQTAGNALVAKP